ncbi:MAG: DUF2283 domain-containing protein [Chloroflexi bacterium]|nr:DUF2283 domain-containing protein [Chloroflexota bacterium]
MKIIYDPETDTLSLLLRDSVVSESDELEDGIIVDYDSDGRIVGFELLEASKYIEEPQGILYQLKGRLSPSSRP